MPMFLRRPRYRRRGDDPVIGLFGFLTLLGLTAVACATVLYTGSFKNRILVWIAKKWGKTAARIVCFLFGAALMVFGIWGIVLEFRQKLR